MAAKLAKLCCDTLRYFWLTQHTSAYSLSCLLVMKYFWWGCFVPPRLLPLSAPSSATDTYPFPKTTIADICPLVMVTVKSADLFKFAAHELN